VSLPATEQPHICSTCSKKRPQCGHTRQFIENYCTLWIGGNRLKDCYQNKESKEIEKTLNDARKELGLEDFLPPVEVWFKKSSKGGKPT
jgi:hypothetical protein